MIEVPGLQPNSIQLGVEQRSCPECSTPFLLAVRCFRLVPQHVLADGSVEGTARGVWGYTLCAWCLYRERYDADPVTRTWRLQERKEGEPTPIGGEQDV